MTESTPWDGAGVVETYTGGGFDLFDPDPVDVRLPDIAAGLAHTCRFGGHCRTFYSVAHHSLHVSRELADAGPRLALLGLLHDAGEAYVGDVPRPLKSKLETVERLEAEILDAVWEGLGVAAPTDEEWARVMAADDRLLAYEADNVLQDASWADEPADLCYELHSGEIEQIRERFLARAERLRTD
ncbi:hypothetical protein BRC62_07820 [Halobacteriales archaeon QH_10_67_13]|nr:MAG: hypothetical protein BRC62_07820 [Halobacteriales archaeon QH_10_67_13]